MNDVQRMEVGNGFQDLSHHIAGVPLRVVALVQNPVKHLSPWGSVDKGVLGSWHCHSEVCSS